MVRVLTVLVLSTLLGCSHVGHAPDRRPVTTVHESQLPAAAAALRTCALKYVATHLTSAPVPGELFDSSLAECEVERSRLFNAHRDKATWIAGELYAKDGFVREQYVINRTDVDYRASIATLRGDALQFIALAMSARDPNQLR